MSATSTGYFSYVFGVYIGYTTSSASAMYTEVWEYENAYVIIVDVYGEDDHYSMATITLKDGSLSTTFEAAEWLIGP